MRADDFRQYLANSCCSCVEAIPSFALVILALLLIMLLIAVVPLAFALTYSSPAAQTMKTTTMKPSLPSDLEPLDNATLAMNSTGADGERDDAEEHLLMSTALIPKNISACHGFGFACASNPVGTAKHIWLIEILCSNSSNDNQLSKRSALAHLTHRFRIK